MARLRQTLRMAELSLAEQFAAAELFRGTMVRHSAIVYRDDSPGLYRPISFAGVDWIGYVPMRMPETICVQEQLPAGAAAVLINRSHTYTDLLMTINPAEKCMLDAADGNRTISKIAKGSLPALPEQTRKEMARTFFERLWWHDQVVFDTSSTPG
jgi:hypothetical protein